MSLNNTEQDYGWIAIILHWLSAIAVFGLFGLGFWMVELSYYDSWYNSGPELHKSIGLSLLAVMLFRVFWRISQPHPAPLVSHSKLERKVGNYTHKIFYLSLFTIMFSGYFISTSDGRGIEVFQLFTVPGFGSFVENQEDIAGLIHKFIAYFVIVLSVLHALAALKHHFIDKDITFTRMLGKK